MSGRESESETEKLLCVLVKEMCVSFFVCVFVCVCGWGAFYISMCVHALACCRPQSHPSIFLMHLNGFVAVSQLTVERCLSFCGGLAVSFLSAGKGGCCFR